MRLRLDVHVILFKPRVRVGLPLAKSRVERFASPLPEWKFLTFLSHEEGNQTADGEQAAEEAAHNIGSLRDAPATTSLGEMFVLDRVELLDEHVVILFRRHSDGFERARRLRHVRAPEHLTRSEASLSAVHRQVQSHDHLYTVLPFAVHLSLTPLGAQFLHFFGHFGATSHRWRLFDLVLRSRHPRGRGRAIHVRPRRRHGRTRRDLRAAIPPPENRRTLNPTKNRVSEKARFWKHASGT